MQDAAHKAAGEVAFLGLGSNLGNRLAQLKEAAHLLAGPDLFLSCCSSVYESDAAGPVKDQPLFLNLVLQVRTWLDPLALLRRCQQVEQALGRRRLLPKGPRTMDLDLLLMGERVMNEPELVLPHPELVNRSFVVIPLTEIASDIRDPVSGRPLRCLAARLQQGHPVKRVAGPVACQHK